MDLMYTIKDKQQYSPRMYLPVSLQTYKEGTKCLLRLEKTLTLAFLLLLLLFSITAILHMLT